MPHYTHRGRSSSSSSSNTHSPAPKHRSRSPKNSGAGRYSLSSSARRDDSRKRSRSYSPRRRHSPPRRRSPPGRKSNYHSSRRSPSPRRRSPRRSPPRRSSPGRRRSKSPARRKSPGYQKSRRSPSPRSRFHGSSPSRSSKRSPQRQRSPPRESARRAEAETSESSSYPAPTSTAPRTEPAPSVPTALKRDLVLDPEPQRVEWIPGLDLQPEPIQTSVTSLATTTIHKEPEVRREEPRDKPVESSYSQPSSSHSRDPYPTSSHEHSVSSSTRHQSDHSRPRERSRSPQYSQSRSHGVESRSHGVESRSHGVESRSHGVESSRSPVGRRHEAERDFNWVHPKPSEPSRSGIPDTVRVSVNLPASPGDVDLRRDRSSTAPWERKRQEQEQRSQREAEEQREQERQLAAAERERREREAVQQARAEPTVKLADPHRYFPPSSASTVASRGSLSSRFGAGTDNEHPFYPKENITVGIQRNLKDGDERIPVKRHFVESEVVVPRGKEEGERPLSLREEFVTREEVVEERRIIKVVKPDNEKSSSHREVKRENFEVRREHFSSKPLSERWKEHTDISTSSHRRSDTHDKEKSSYRDDVRHVDSVRDDRKVRHRSRSDERKRTPTRDVRKVSDSSRKSTKDSSYDYRDRGSFGSKRGRYEQDPHDLRHNLASKRRTSEKSDDQEHHRDIRSRIGEKDTSRERPDFSKREDKYQYEEWKDRPEMIPKGSSYYEHDNRDTFVPRGRGRGLYRGRGGYTRGRGRGFTPYRGRGYVRGRGRGYTRGFSNFSKRSSADGDREWKHDKFKEMEDNKDERPTSTTEK